MKYAVVLVLACLGVCFAAVDKDGVEVWGIETQDVLGSKRIEVDSSWFEVKVREFTFPEGNTRFPIRGIKHADYKSHPVTVNFLNGGLGWYNATIRVTSQRGHGIKSEFVFFV